MENELFHYRLFYDDHDPEMEGLCKSIDLYFPEEKTFEWIRDYWFTYWAKPCDDMPEWEFCRVLKANEKALSRFDKWIDIN